MTKDGSCELPSPKQVAAAAAPISSWHPRGTKAVPQSWWSHRKASWRAAGEKLNVAMEAAGAAVAACSSRWGLTRMCCLLRCQASCACIRS